MKENNKGIISAVRIWSLIIGLMAILLCAQFSSSAYASYPPLNTYDANGSRLSQIEVQSGSTETTNYDYDSIDRLKDFTIAGANTTVIEYAYEGYNRKTEKETTNGVVGKDRNYTYDETDWLTRVEDSGGQQTLISYQYDNDGNMILMRESAEGHVRAQRVRLANVHLACVCWRKYGASVEHYHLKHSCGWFPVAVRVTVRTPFLIS